MRTMIPSVLSLVLVSGVGLALAQLPPEILADSYLIRVEQAIREGDPIRAWAEIDKIILLQKEHELDLSEEFLFRYAKAAATAQRPEQALESVTKYLMAAGRSGSHYAEALELMNQAQDEMARRNGQPVATTGQPPPATIPDVAVQGDTGAFEGSQASDCDLRRWNTREFFERTTVQDVNACLEAGADPNARDVWKSTPLHWAAETNEDPAVIQALLARGADPNAQNDNKQIPLDRAKDVNNLTALEILRHPTANGIFGCGGTQVQTDWSGRNLRKAKLEGENLSGFNLSGVDLEKAKLRGADLRGANLARAKLHKADLRGVQLCGASLRHADLNKTDLRRADLRGADLRGADLEKTKLEEARLQKADLRGAKVRKVNASRTDLRGANLRGGYFRIVRLVGSDLRNADLHKADLSGENFLGSPINNRLIGADLRGADLSEADLRLADFQEADLRGANLRGANLEEVYLREARLQNADLRGANLYKAYLHKADLRGANLQGANLDKTKDLHKANLQGANLSGAIRQGTRRDSGPGALEAAIGIIGGTAIAAAGGGSEEAVEAGTVFAEEVIRGQSPVASSGGGNSSSKFDTALRNLENSCGERYRSGFSEQDHGRFYCLDAFARHCALKQGPNPQQLEALKHDFAVLRSQGTESRCPYFQVLGGPGHADVSSSIDREKRRREQQAQQQEQARQAAQREKRRIAAKNAEVLNSNCSCISIEDDGEYVCMDGFVSAPDSERPLCDIRR